jgi:hypothetical protein
MIKMAETYYDDEDGILRGKCAKHGEFVGDAIGCPQCFADSENAEADTTEVISCKECLGYQETIDNGDEVCTTCQTCGREWEWGT